MKKYREYFGLQLKMVLKTIPVILAGTVVIATLLLVGIIAADNILSQEENQLTAINVALVINDDNRYTDMAISLLMREENIKRMCNFVEMTQEEALKAMKNGEISATIVVPENFLVGILNGANIPARIILPDGNGYSQSIVFRELVNSGATDLATAQAAIYAVNDLCYATGIDAIQEAEDYLNKKLFMYVLSRNKYYDQVEISKTGDLSVVEFYIASGIVMFLLLGGVVCGELMGRDSLAFSICIERSGIKKWMVIMARLLSVSLVYFLMLTAIYIVAGMLGVIDFSPISVLAIAVVSFAVFAINIFVFQLADNRITGTIVLFLSTIIMMFLGGNIIPEMFLPGIVNVIGAFSPTKWLVKLVGQVVTGEVLIQNLMIAMMIGIVFAGIAIGIKYIDGKRRI